MKKGEIQALVDRWFPLWVDGNAEKVVEVYSEDVVFKDPARPGGIFGKKAFLEYVTKVLKAFRRWDWDVKEIIPYDEGDGFIIIWNVTVTVAATGGKAAFPGIDLVWTRDGKIARNEVYFDRSVLLAEMRRGR